MSIAEKLTEITENVPKVFEAGKKSEYDMFWDSFQDYGKRTNYYVAFMYTYWNNDNFKPKYPLKPTDLNNCFASSGLRGDFTKLCDLDTSNCTNMASAFAYCYGITKIGVLDLRKVTVGSAFCQSCKSLETIEKVIFKEDGCWRISNCNGCSSLKNITIEGKMGGGDISFSVSPLTAASIKSIIQSLHESGGYTLSLSKSAVNSAFETSEGANDGSLSEEWQALVDSKSNWEIKLV